MHRRPFALLALAAASATGAVVVWLAAFHVPLGRVLDGGAMQAFTGVARPPLTPSIRGVALLADPWPFALTSLAIVALALARRRWLMAALVPAILLMANVTTHVLKPALADSRIVDLHGAQTAYPGSWPSGHATASMSLALCFVLVAGPRLRALAAFTGAAYAIAVGYALVVLGFHLPSDVLGGYLVAATFTLLGTAALAALEARWPARAARVTVPPVLLSAPMLGGFATALLVAAALAVLVRAPDAPDDVLQHPTAVLAGIGIAGLGLALTTGLARVLRR
ncbi:MAG TPA: phosphatase PAP2 family protein [Solirubrobacteraceae bacterium]|jgi:membrane-associated phospholipid phosphatase|nr:phosphatase PAP2 family protein [Solirubrobacteraceae bacterium]